MKVKIGIDNGVTGSIGIIVNGEFNTIIRLYKMPVISQQDYTKKKKRIHRIDFKAFKALVEWAITDINGKGMIAVDGGNVEIAIERPMINSTRFNASMSAARALEATLCVLEELGLGFRYIDSKEWQKAILPLGIKGSVDLKRASKEIGIRLYPELAKMITSQKDADGLLIARYLNLK